MLQVRRVLKDAVAAMKKKGGGCHMGILFQRLGIAIAGTAFGAPVALVVGIPVAVVSYGLAKKK